MNDLKTIDAIRNRDEAALEGVIDRYSRLLWSVASAVLSRAGTEQDIEECVADAFIYLWDHAEGFDPQKGKLKTWLSIIVRSKALDRYRSLQKDQTVPLDETVAQESGKPDSTQENVPELSQAMWSLPEQDRDILIRRYYHRQKPKEIALALNLAVKQVDNSLYRSKQKLRRQLTE